MAHRPCGLGQELRRFRHSYALQCCGAPGQHRPFNTARASTARCLHKWHSLAGCCTEPRPPCKAHAHLPQIQIHSRDRSAPSISARGSPIHTASSDSGTSVGHVSQLSQGLPLSPECKLPVLPSDDVATDGQNTCAVVSHPVRNGSQLPPAAQQPGEIEGRFCYDHFNSQFDPTTMPHTSDAQTSPPSVTAGASATLWSMLHNFFSRPSSSSTERISTTAAATEIPHHLAPLHCSTGQPPGAGSTSVHNPVFEEPGSSPGPEECWASPDGSPVKSAGATGADDCDAIHDSAAADTATTPGTSNHWHWRANEVFSAESSPSHANLAHRVHFGRDASSPDGF